MNKMMKLAVFVSTIFVTFAARPTIWQDTLTAKQRTINTSITSAIDEIHASLTIAKEKAEQDNLRLHFAVDNRIYDLYEKIRQHGEKIDKALVKITEHVDDIDVAECWKVSETYQTGIENSVQRTTQCLNNRKTFGDRIFQSMNIITNTLLASLSAIFEEALGCSARVDGNRQAVVAINCINKAEAKANFTIKKSIPAFKSNLAKLGHQLETLSNNLFTCANSTRVFVDLKQETELDIAEMKNCIDKQIAKKLI